MREKFPNEFNEFEYPQLPSPQCDFYNFNIKEYKKQYLKAFNFQRGLLLASKIKGAEEKIKHAQSAWGPGHERLGDIGVYFEVADLAEEVKEETKELENTLERNLSFAKKNKRLSIMQHPIKFISSLIWKK